MSSYFTRHAKLTRNTMQAMAAAENIAVNKKLRGNLSLRRVNFFLLVNPINLMLPEKFIMRIPVAEGYLFADTKAVICAFDVCELLLIA